MGDERLEQRLRELGSRLDHPDASNVARGVAERLRRDLGPARLPRQPRAARVAAAAAVVVVLAGTAIGAVLIRGVEIERVPGTPTAPSPAERPPLQLGERVTLAEASEAVAIDVLVPRRLGRPDAVYVGRKPQGGRVTLVYRPRGGLPRDPNTGAGMLVTLFRGTTEPAFVRKEVGPGTSVRPISVDGAPGMWIEGAPHTVQYLDERGDEFRDTLRLAENVLIWQAGSVTLRLESRLGLGQSLDVASSMA